MKIFCIFQWFWSVQFLKEKQLRIFMNALKLVNVKKQAQEATMKLY